MEPITREEYYLAKIAGTYKGKTPKPVTIEEYYLATMAGDYSGNTPQPVTRLQYYMAKVAGVWGGSIPAPVTRLEYYWAAIASGEGEVFPPVTREEHFLVLVADAYSVVLTVVTGNPALLENSKGNRGLESLTLYGKSTQGSTTGANILKDTYLSLCKGDVDLFTANGLFTANSNYEKNVEFNLFFTEGSIFADSIKDEETYYIAFRPIGFTPVYRFQLSLKNGAHEIIATSVGAIVASVSGAVLKRTARIQLYFFNVSGAIPIVSGSKFQMIFSKNPDCIYEPYTGGAPSPSPSYPQEIESAGQNGEIEVEVLSGNLFDKSAAYDLTQSGGWSASFDGEELKVVGNNITIGSIRLFNYKKTLPAGTYTFSISKPLPFKIRIDNYFLIKKGDTSATVTFDNGVSMSHFAVDAEPGATFNEQRFKIMLNAGSTALPYELYKPAQTLIIPTSGGLPGIRVSSGGNYTDADGQQWVCDEVDFKKGVYVQRIGKRTITSKDVFHKSGMNTDDVNYFSLGNFSLHIGTIGEKDVLMSNCFVAGINQGFSAWGKIFLSSAFDGKVYFSVEAQKYPDEETFKQWAVENGLMFLYQLTDIIETNLTAKGLAAYKALRTYSPTTTVINDAGAGMSVGYAKMK
jgi:hypothetical protein